MIKHFKGSILLAIATLLCGSIFAQTTKEDVPKGWHLLDQQKDGYYGISLQQAYDFVHSKNLKSKPVIVAVIDSGVDTTHEDLKAILWHNPGEIPGNGIDDDKNGYVDDVYGWNFLGGHDGRNVKEDSYEVNRVYHSLKSKWENFDSTKLSTLSKDEAYEYEMWKKAAEQVNSGSESEGGGDISILKKAYENTKISDSVIQVALNKPVYTGNDLDSLKPASAEAKKAKSLLLYLFKANNLMESTNKDFMTDFGEYVSGEERKAEAKTTPPKDYRGEIVKDNYDDINDRFYGNNDVMANTPMHGTHVSGIIGAVRNNGIGMNGVADNVRIMMVRAVPDGDEHDKDIALAIRYAVDNGAEVINMSFGKSFSPQKKWVDDAVKYAQSKGVLLVHAAGNESSDNDTTWNFPTPIYKFDEGKADNWITVGASGDPKAGGLVAGFSNFGKKEVDVFAPGVKIYSTLPGGNTYGNLQGTSMASPVVAGLAAFILEYYPNLSAEQVKSVIEKSTVKPDIKVKNPANGEMENLSDISKTGGIVNAYEAIKLASTLKGERKTVNPVKTKSSVKQKKKG